MEKRVYCLIHPRRKMIKFVSNQNKKDSEIIRDQLRAACLKDAILCKMLRNKEIVFQVKEKCGIWCDMDEDEEIADMSEVNVILISLSPTKTVYYDPHKLETGEKIELDLNVVYAEPENEVPDHPSSNAESENEIPDYPSNIHKNSPCTSNQSLNKVVDCKENENLAEAKEIKKYKKKIRFINQFTVLPELTYDLNSKLEKHGILQSQHHFIRFWGQHLLQLTNEQPTKQDYYNLSTTIVNSYPELRGGNNGNGIVRTQLSAFIRNHRISGKKYLKRKKPSEEQMSFSGTALKHVAIGNSANIVDKFNESDLSRANEELKKYKEGKNTQHYKRLLLITKSSRRQWIENESQNVSEIIKKFPPLGCYEMIIYECACVSLCSDEETVLMDGNKLLYELFLYYTNEENDDYIGLSEDSEKTKSKIIEEVDKTLLPKKLKNATLYPLWSINEVMDSLDILDSIEGAAPRAVLYFNDSTIEQAFVVADQNIRVEVPEPTTAKILVLLLAAYYAWHRSFPSAYNNALDFFSFKIFKLECKNNAVAKLIRKLDYFQLSLKQ